MLSSAALSVCVPQMQCKLLVEPCVEQNIPMMLVLQSAFHYLPNMVLPASFMCQHAGTNVGGSVW